MKKALQIYFQFFNLIFNSLLFNDKSVIRMSILIKNYKDYIFIIFINDYKDFIKIFDTLFKFLYKKYFSRYIFEFVYLIEFKISLFANNLKMLEFEENIINL